MNISVKVMRSRLTRAQLVKSITGIALTLILTSTIHWPNIMLDITPEPVIIAPMIETWPLDDTLNPWLNNAK